MAEIESYLSKVEICPDCGNKKFVIGLTPDDHSGLYQHSVLFTTRFRRISVICKSCGLIIKEYIERPERLE